MRRRNFWHILRGIAIIALITAVAAAIVMLLWNALIPSVIGWDAVNYWQAAGLLILCRILFKGFGHHHPLSAHRNSFRFDKEHMEMHERMRHMSWNDRKAYIRNCMAKLHEQEEQKENE
ncbi:MAG: hypothetical protein ACLS4S_00890 [Bacteroides nordii]|jgi:hypothetical protein